MATYNNGLIVSAAASNVTLTSKQYAVATFTTATAVGAGTNVFSFPVTIHYGPGQTIPASITVPVNATTATYNLSSGVIFTNIA